MLELKIIEGNAKETKLIGFTFAFLKKNWYNIKKWEKAIYKSITFVKDKETNKTYPKVYHLFNLDQVKELANASQEEREGVFKKLQDLFILSKVIA